MYTNTNKINKYFLFAARQTSLTESHRPTLLRSFFTFNLEKFNNMSMPTMCVTTIEPLNFGTTLYSEGVQKKPPKD